MQEIDASGLQYLTREDYKALHEQIDKYNRQARWVNTGAKQLTATDAAAVLQMLNTIDAMVMTIASNTDLSTAVREEAGGVQAAVTFARNELAGQNAMQYNRSNATYTEDAYFKS